MSPSFFGGVHPNDSKIATHKMEIHPLNPPGQVVIPMSLHIGAPCEPCVKVGDAVLMGQKIGESSSPVSAPIHSSVSGVVSAMEPRLHPNGSHVMSVIIDNDGLDTRDSGLASREDAESTEALIKIIREAGIVGMGGATFPTAFKIESGLGRVDTIIINAAECEPFITSDHRIMLEHPDEVLAGIRILIKIFGLPSATLAIEANKMDAVRLLQTRLNDKDSDINISIMKTRYPQGAEKQLIQSITGREVPPGGLPADVGCVVFNLFTAYCVYRAVHEGMPVIERVVTVSGGAVSEPKNLLVRIGTPLDYIFEAAGGFKVEPHKILMGGPMMGVAQHSLSVPVIKGTNAVIALTKKEDRSVPDPVCIRCGKCVSVCPVRLMPIYMQMYERSGELGKLAELNVTDCIECGACTYICPGRLHLTQSFRAAKVKLAAKARAEKAKEAKQ